MTQRHPSRISGKCAKMALTSLLYGCTLERLASFTAQGLAASYRVPIAEAERMLSRAREGRLV
jgi:hypothetical protein